MEVPQTDPMQGMSAALFILSLSANFAVRSADFAGRVS